MPNITAAPTTPSTRTLKLSYNKGIRIIESENPYKAVQAEEISVFYGSPSRPHDTNSRSDINAKVLCNHLNSKFPELVHGFKLMGSQKPFDIFCLETRTLIELKSVKGNKKKLITNASIYPDSILGKYVISEAMLPEGAPVEILEEPFDVLVVCISQLQGIVQNFAIVDGAYWGVDEEHYLGCQALFGALNNNIPEVLSILPQTKFIRDYSDGRFADGLNLGLRKLIQLTNPIGRLGTPGFYKVM